MVLERGIVSAGKYPGFVRRPRSIRTGSNKISANLDDARAGGSFLRKNVAKNATFFLVVVIEPGAKFIKHSARNECGRGQLRVGMSELLARARPEILEDADVAEAGVAFEVLDALGNEQEELLDLGVAGVPELAVMFRVLDQQLVSADVGHAVVNAFSAAINAAFDVVDGARMDNRPGRPRTSLHRRTGGYLLQLGLLGRSGAEAALGLGTRREFGEIVAGHDPGAGQRIFA